jgi:hypothetical protein
MHREYPLDVFPGAWALLENLAASGSLVSSDEVPTELRNEDDDVYAWAKGHETIFLPLSHEVQNKAKEILRTHPNLVDLKKRKSGADPFLIATAVLLNCSLVTEEKPSGGPNRSKIPDVCRYYHVDCFGILEMLRREGLRLE